MSTSPTSSTPAPVTPATSTSTVPANVLAAGIAAPAAAGTPIATPAPAVAAGVATAVNDIDAVEIQTGYMNQVAAFSVVQFEGPTNGRRWGMKVEVIDEGGIVVFHATHTGEPNQSKAAVKAQ